MTRRVRRSAALLLVGLASASPLTKAAQWTVVHAGQLPPVPGAEVLETSTVVVRDGRVERVAPGYLTAADLPIADGDAVTLHDLSSHFVMAGFIDGHVHLTLEFGPGYRVQLVEASDADLTMRAAGYARKTLMAGFTTVRDLGATGVVGPITSSSRPPPACSPNRQPGSNSSSSMTSSKPSSTPRTPWVDG